MSAPGRAQSVVRPPDQRASRHILCVFETGRYEVCDVCLDYDVAARTLREVKPHQQLVEEIACKLDSDGSTQCDAGRPMHVPRDVVPTRLYPVAEYIYPGAGGRGVTEPTTHNRNSVESPGGVPRKEGAGSTGQHPLEGASLERPRLTTTVYGRAMAN